MRTKRTFLMLMLAIATVGAWAQSAPRLVVAEIGREGHLRPERNARDDF